jgi:uncharacterized protein YecE (DUF72 family)
MKDGMIYIGTSGWQYDWWRKSFYAGAPKRLWLQLYASRFPIVEVNNSFYQLPREETFERWKAESPPGFLFAVKASRYITHIRRLRDCEEPVRLFWSRATHLGPKLGPVLFQFPPNLGKEKERLRDFLPTLPRDMRAAFEFRHDSWRDDDVLGLLDGVSAAWVLADRPVPSGARRPSRLLQAQAADVGGQDRRPGREGRVRLLQQRSGGRGAPGCRDARTVPHRQGPRRLGGGLSCPRATDENPWMTAVRIESR